jgi:hypothetical protein
LLYLQLLDIKTRQGCEFTKTVFWKHIDTKPDSQNSGARETGIAREATIPVPSLGNQSASNNGGIIGGGVFYEVSAEGM